MAATRKTRSAKVTGAGLRHSGVPLGGLGTGSVELRSDGYFHEWQIMNNGPWGAGPDLVVPSTEPGMREQDISFFAMQVTGAGINRSAVLGLVPPYSGILNNPYHAPFVEHATAIDADARFPFTRLRYRFSDMPVDVELEAFSPFVPLDPKHSAIPTAFFRFSVRNRTRQKVCVSIVHQMRNLSGYCEPDKLSHVEFNTDGSKGWLTLTREGVEPHLGCNGSLVIGAFGGAETAYTWAAHPRTDRDLWEPLRLTGALDNVDHGGYAGAVGNMGAERDARRRAGLPHAFLCQTQSIRASSRATFNASLSWHFPNMWERDYGGYQRTGERIGHRYAAWFNNATDVFTYGAEGHESLRARTRAFTDAFFSSTLPNWLLRAINAQLTTLVKSSWWDERDRFGIWEGLGCCGLQTTDITHYASFPIALLFPEIQKSQMRLTVAAMRERGKIPHMMPGTFGCCDTDERGRIDLIPQFILLVWRDMLWTGDLGYAAEMWGTVVDSIAFFRNFDSDGDGLPNNTGPDQTYDQFPLKGTSAFVGLLYAGALQAAAHLGEQLGHAEEAEQYRSALREVLPKLEQQLWNGSWYRLSHDSHSGRDNEGVMADQLNADWFVRQSTGEGLLRDARVRRALTAVVKHCTNPAHGYLSNCAWPKGGAVHIGRHTADQANMPWTGVEYAVAAHLMLMGMEKESLAIARNVWERHERTGLRFDHIECGEHYYRALSSWALYLAWCGFSVDETAGVLALRPRSGKWQAVLNTSTAWGTARCCGPKTLRIDVAEGVLSLRTLLLRGVTARKATVTLSGRTVECTVKKRAGGTAFVLSKRVEVDAGKVLTVKWQ